VAQCTQFLEQLRLGKLPPDSAEVVNSSLPPVHPDAIVSWDENHKKVVLGHTSKYENRVARNPFDNAPTPVEFGVILAEKSMQIAIKFPGEARGVISAAMRMKTEGTYEGVKVVPYDYTGKWVVGIKGWDAAKSAEMVRVLPLIGVWKGPDYGYKQRYPDTWEAEVERVISVTHEREVAGVKASGKAKKVEMEHVIKICEGVWKGPD
jgi:hypothetical protein